MLTPTQEGIRYKKKTSDDRYRDVTRSLVVAGFSHARAPVAQLVRASDWNSEDSGSNPGWISSYFFPSTSAKKNVLYNCEEHTIFFLCFECCTQTT